MLQEQGLLPREVRRWLWLLRGQEQEGEETRGRHADHRGGADADALAGDAGVRAGRSGGTDAVAPTIFRMRDAVSATDADVGAAGPAATSHAVAIGRFARTSAVLWLSAVRNGDVRSDALPGRRSLESG